MLSLEELQRIVSRYLDDDDSFDNFADEYRKLSRGKFGASAEVLHACLKIDAALSMACFDSATETEFRQELENAIHPFAFVESALVLSESLEIDLHFGINPTAMAHRDPIPKVLMAPKDLLSRRAKFALALS